MRLIPHSSFLILLTLSLLLISCDDDFCTIGCGPEPPALTSQSVRLESGYMNSCSESSTLFVRRAELTWRVVRPFGVNQTEVLSNGSRMIENDDFDPNNLDFVVQAPEQGSFMIRVDVELECDDCCNSLFGFEVNRISCPNDNRRNGEAFFGAIGVLASQVVVPSPIVLSIVPLGCSQCRDLC